MVEIDEMLYRIFADYARSHGVEAAEESLAGAVAREDLLSMRDRFDEARKKVQTGGPVVIAAGKPDWYPGPTPQDKFWNGLYEQFQSDGWTDDRLLGVNQSSDKVVAHTARPDQSSWVTRGLVVGYVQSGKTTNFLATAAKMADLQYGLIIVLSGIHNALRKQTQMRLEAALSHVPADAWFRLTELERDFRLPSFDAAALLAGRQTGVAVVKKNAAVLRKLRDWLQTEGARTALRERPLLVIDDEADQASVETGTINPLIKQLLRIAAKSTYIGYTATPFANVFINPADEDDLYPRDFILSLPRPEGYFGPEKIFGRDVITSELGDADEPADGFDMVRTIDIEKIGALQPTAKNADGFEPELTDELRDALDWFWLATAARRVRGDSGHSSMLVHTSVKTVVHESFRPMIDAHRFETEQGVLGNEEATFQRLHGLWQREYGRVGSEQFGRQPVLFQDVAAKLPEVLGACRTVLDNFRSADRLDFSAAPSQVVIAVGGNTLSRGLTLEGLVVSFFVRAASAYDTLMQMGRWFGYREGYEELPRIWMTAELERNFRHLSRVEYEMRDDIDRYQRENLTPMEAAVRIRTHPALRITAKMGAASPQFVSFEGRRFQTRFFLAGNESWLQRNLDAASALVQSSGSAAEMERGHTGAKLFRDVPANAVDSFLSSYRIHPDSADMDAQLMRRYIAKCRSASQPSLEEWSVAIVEAPEGKVVKVGGLEVRMVTRGRVNDLQNPDRADIKTLMSKEDRVADLQITRSEARRSAEQALRDMRNEDPKHATRGLLVLYVIDPEGGFGGGVNRERLAMGASRPIVGVGVVFPGQTSPELVVAATKVAVELSSRELEIPDDRALGVDDDPEWAGQG